MQPMVQNVIHTATVGEESAGMRLDVFLAEIIEDASRTYLKKVIQLNLVTVNAQTVRRASRSVREGDVVTVDLPPPPTIDLEPEDIPLDVLHEDEHLLVINKAAGLVVHPGPGHYNGTLVNAVIYHCKDFQHPTDPSPEHPGDPARPGIVHRLDRFTSGVMVVAKTQKAFLSLAKQAREHTFDRCYLALVRGQFQGESGVVNATIGRSLSDSGKMAVTSVKSREAITHFEVLETFGAASLIALRLETGRTHQIRVHMRYAGRPVLGDPLYGVTDYAGMKISHEAREAFEALPGQALHAELLGFEHPATGKRVSFTAPPPEAFQRALDALRRSAVA